MDFGHRVNQGFYGKYPEKLRGSELVAILFLKMHTHVLIPDKSDIFLCSCYVYSKRRTSKSKHKKRILGKWFLKITSAVP